MKVSKFALLVIVVALASAGVLMCYGWYVFPLPGGDSIVFLPPALLYANGHGFVNPLYRLPLGHGSNGFFPFDYYPPLYSLFMTVAAKIVPGVRSLFVAGSLISFASLMVYSSELIRTLNKPKSVFVAAVMVLSVVYLATYLLPTFGRPELLSSLVIGIMYLIVKYKHKLSGVRYVAAIVVTLALLGGAQLAGYYFAFLFWAIAEVLTSEDLKPVIFKVAGVFVCSTLGVCFLLAITPGGGFWEKGNAIYSHIIHVFSRTDRSLYLYFYYWFVSSLNFGFGILVIIAGLFYIKSLANACQANSVSKNIVVLLLLFMVLVGIGRFNLYAAPVIYNSTQFIIPILLYTLSNLSHLKRPGFRGISMLAVLTGGLIVWVRFLVLFSDYVQDGRDYVHVRTIFRQKLAEYPNAVVAPGLWSLSDCPEQLKILDTTIIMPGLIVFTESANNEISTRRMDGWEKLYDNRVPNQKKIGGLPLRHAQGFTFAIFRVR